MTVTELRLINARYLSDQCGGITKFAERVSRTQGQVTHIIGKHPIKGIGHRLARHIEKSFSKPVGWLDATHTDHKPATHPNDAGVNDTAGRYNATPIGADDAALLALINGLSHHNKALIVSLARALSRAQ